MAWLIDSSVFVELDRHGESLRALETIVPSESFAISSITASELLVGVHRTTSERQRVTRQHFVETVLNALLVLPFDVDVARTHAWLFVELTSRGRRIESHDMIIAATALTHDYAVLTHNVRHFERVPGLTVQQPRW